VQERDQIITNLNSKIQQDGLVGETARGSQIAEREKAIAEQMVHLQEVAKHQYDMQAQLMEVQEMLQQQQAQMEEQSHQQALAQQQQLQMAAQSQQLAALQQGIGSYSQAGDNSKVFRIDDIPDEDEEDEDDDEEESVGAGKGAVQGRSISKTPTPKEWSQEQGSINASNRFQSRFPVPLNPKLVEPRAGLNQRIKQVPITIPCPPLFMRISHPLCAIIDPAPSDEKTEIPRRQSRIDRANSSTQDSNLEHI